VELTGPHAAYWPGFPPWCRRNPGRTEALAVERDKLGVIVEDRLPCPRAGRYGQFTHELFSMLAFAAEAPGPGR